MKKIILAAAMVLGFAVAGTAQPRAVGVRVGWCGDISYQHSMDSDSMNSDFLEVDLGLNNFNSLDFTTTYNFMLAEPKWTERGEWGFYAGPGGSFGMKLFGGSNFFHVSLAAMVGFEYTFWFPLQLSFDIKPQIGVGLGHGFYWGMTPSLGVRYRF